MKRRTSEVWSYFRIESHKNKIAVCSICQQKCSYKTTVSNLKQHLRNKHFGLKSRKISRNTVMDNDNLSLIKSERKFVPVQAGPSTLPTVNPLDNQPHTNYIEKSSDATIIQTQIQIADKKITASQIAAIDEKLLLLFIKDFQPFSVLEDKGFREYSTALNPAYRLPTKQHISNTFIPALYERTLKRVRQIDLKSINSLSLTTDLWTTESQDAYIAVTAHYIDGDFERQNVLLDCAPLPCPYKPIHVAEEIIRLLTDLDLQKDKILIVTTDNGANTRNAVCNHLQLNHFGCFAHTIDLILENALNLAPIKSFIDRVKSIVSHYKRNTAAMEKLLRYQIQRGVSQPKGLIQAVPTQWNSVYFMLERFLELEDALKIVGLLDRTLPMPSDEQWDMCKDLCNILKPMQELTQQMCLERYVTGSLVIVYTRVLRNVYENKIPSNIHPEAHKSVVVIVDQLKTIMDQIEFHEIYSICTLLDPRYKSHCFQDKGAVEKAKRGLIELVTMEVKKKNIINMSAVISAQSSNNSQQGKNSKLSLWDNLNEILGPADAQTPLDSALTEVERYLEDPLLPIKDDLGNFNNPSKWWQNHQYSYPNLAKIYQQKCSAMSTSVPCERIFSKSGYLISDRRTRLKPESVKHLMFLNANMPIMNEI